MVSPAVVGIAVTETEPTDSGTQTVEGLGTGVFVDQRGYILTNNHVAGGASQIDVVMSDGTKQPGKLVWCDKALDLAIVKAEGGPYPTVEMGTSQNLRVGDTVVTIGTPLTLNFQHTVTSGIVSALRRTLKVSTDDGLSFMEELIQTDAPINPGNSGGPLCDLNGRVVGINTLKVTEAEGIGFAIPIEVAKPIVEIVERDGTYTTPYLGLYAIDADIARYYGEAAVSRGILVVETDPEGPASKASIQKNDLITQMDGQPVDTILKMREIIYAHKPGESITVNWVREGGQAGQSTAVLTKKPAS
jgi:S1-C subfamily serine protease